MSVSFQTHILVISPDPAPLAKLLALLRANFARVSVALGAQQAVVRCQALMPDLILSEFELGELRGDMFIRMLRANPKTASIPVVFLSSKNCTATEIQALRSGAQDFLHHDTHEVLALERIKLQLLAGLGRLAQQTPPQSVSQPQADTCCRISAAQQYIADHLSGVLNAKTIAALFGVSDRRLNDEFKLATGSSVHDFVRSARMQYAMCLLRQSDLPVTQVAVETGYKNPANFATAFRQYSGLSPSDYRAQQRKKGHK